MGTPCSPAALWAVIQTKTYGKWVGITAVKSNILRAAQEHGLVEGSDPCSQHGLCRIPELQLGQPGPQFPVSPNSQRVVCWGLMFSCPPGVLGVSHSWMDLCAGRFTLSTRQFQWNCRSKSCPSCSGSSVQMWPRWVSWSLPGTWACVFPQGRGKPRFRTRQGPIPMGTAWHYPVPPARPGAVGRSREKKGGNSGTQGGCGGGWRECRDTWRIKKDGGSVRT